MVFNSLNFFIFSAVFFPLYFALRGKARLWLCLIASYVFYGAWDWRFLGLIVTSTLIDYYLGLSLEDEQDQTRRKRLLQLSLFANLGFLAFFKYFNFFIESATAGIQSMGYDGSLSTLHIILPVGISFYTFQSMSYSIDVYRKQIPVERNLLRFATFISFFPQLVAGPIVRASDFLPQFAKDREFEWSRFQVGLGQILWGFFKKVAIADSIAPFVDQCFADPSKFGGLHLAIGVVFYSFQIYCDFSGYSDIAIGLARIMGFDFPKNFNKPYFSQDFSEFWQRWHISLSGWLRDYLYIPLGGSRGGKLFTWRNLMITMLLGGLWHGAAWVFVLWGFLHGSYQVLGKILSPYWRKLHDAVRTPKFIRVALNVAIVYFLTCFAWVYFRAGAPNIAMSDQIPIAHGVIGGIFSGEGWNFGAVINKFIVLKGVLLIGMMLFVEILDEKMPMWQMVDQRPAFRVVSFASLLWLIALFGVFSASAFIYFQF